MKTWIIPIILLPLFIGCGSSTNTQLNEEVNNTLANSNIEENLDENTTSTLPSSEESIPSSSEKTKGYLIDAPISGANYLCQDGAEGITNTEGMFECTTAPITFKVGNLILGTINTFTPDGKVYPQDLLKLRRNNFSDNRLKLLTRFLQALDDDGDIQERITITQSIREGFKKTTNFDQLSLQEIEILLQTLHKNMPPECIALQHLGAPNLSCNPDGSYTITSQSNIYTPAQETITPQDNTPPKEAKIFSSALLTEKTLDGTSLTLSLIHGVHFNQKNFTKEYFSLISDLNNLHITDTLWIDPTHAKITLGISDYNLSKPTPLQLMIDQSILDIDQNMTTNAISIKEDHQTFYTDINLHLNFHHSKTTDLGIDADENLTILRSGTEGSSESFKIANEFWGIGYTHESCNLYDQLLYQVEQKGKGVINLSMILTPPSLRDQNFSLHLNDQISNYPLISDEHINSIEILNAQHGIATILKKEEQYLLNYQPQTDFLGNDTLIISINSIIDGCSFNTTSKLTINVNMNPDYTMVSFFNDQNQCLPFISNGTTNGTLPLESISLKNYKCDGGLNPISHDYIKLNNYFIFDSNNSTQLHRIETTTRTHTLLNANDEFSQVFLNNTFIATHPFYTKRVVFSAFKQSPQEWNEEESFGAGKLPWTAKAQGGVQLLDDFIIGVSGDETISNYTQGYTIAYNPTLSVSEIFNNRFLYSIGYDNTNGNGLYLNKACLFEGIMNCSERENISLFEVNQTEGLKSSTNFSIGTNIFNDLFYFDNTNQNLWITIGKDLTYANGENKTRLHNHLGYRDMEFKARGEDNRVYFQATTSTGEREIGYFYHDISPEPLTYFNCGLNQSCTPQEVELFEINHWFDKINQHTLITLGNSEGKWIIAGKKIYASFRGATGSTLYEVTDGTRKSLPSDLNDATIQACALAGGCNTFIEDMKYINGYLYILGVNTNNKNTLTVINTLDNSSHIIGANMQMNIALYPNEIYPYSQYHRKVLYSTKERNEDTYIYKLYGYNSSTQESTLLKSQTVPVP